MAKKQANMSLVGEEKAGRRPKAQPLPGLEDVRIEALDDVCSQISYIREELNKSSGEEKEHLQHALVLMREHKKKSWQAHGVELTRVPGQEKLRCRTSKEKATAETADDAT